MKEVKWGIIGVGDVNEVKSGPAFNKVENSSIEIVMRRNFEKVKDYAYRHSISNYTDNADEVINNPNVDAIYISTPPSTHAEYTIKSARAKKHVYVEKPMATTYNECEEMIRECEENGVKLFVAYYRRELDYFKKVKELVQSKIIGDVKFVEIKLLLQPNKLDFNKKNLPWRVNKSIAGAGYFYDLASHQFDFLDYVFGPIKTAMGTSTNQLKLYEVEDIISASYLFESNIIGSGIWCFTMSENNNVDQTEIVGTKGKISFSFFNHSPIELITINGDEKIPIEYPKHVQEKLIDSVVKDIQGISQCVSTGKSATRTNRVMEQILYK